MDNYIVSARKYRPATFHSVVGQKSLTTTLKNAIATGKLAHAYLFCGPRGVGKTTCARIFAKTINCLTPTADGEACNTCESCVAFNENRSYNILELDAASNNSVDDIRSLVEQVRIPPQIGHYKVYIIDEVHMLSPSAFNAFLKTLEEPPKHAVFILATTEKHKILATILSRCQIYDFKRIGINDTVEHLQYVASQENVTAEADALMVIAQKADGGMRDALSIFDQVVSFTGGNITYEAVINNLNVLDYEYFFRLTDAILQHDVVNSLILFDEVLNKGFDGYHFVSGLSSHFRDILVCRDEATLVLLEVGANIREKYKQQAKKATNQFLYGALQITVDAELNYRQSKNKRLLVELMLIRLCQLNAPVDPDNEKKKGTLTAPIQEITKPAEPQQAATSASAPQSATTTEQPAQQPATVEAEQPKPPVINAQPRTRPSTISLKKNPDEETVETNAASTVEESDLNQSFTESQLIEFWKSYANNLPEDRIVMKTTMEQCLPQCLSENEIEIVVYNQSQVKELTEELAAIRPFLVQALQNNQFRLTVREREAVEKQKAYSKSEQFAMMQQKNPNLTKLKDMFGLELD